MCHATAALLQRVVANRHRAQLPSGPAAPGPPSVHSRHPRPSVGCSAAGRTTYREGGLITGRRSHHTGAAAVIQASLHTGHLSDPPQCVVRLLHDVGDRSRCWEQRTAPSMTTTSVAVSIIRSIQLQYQQVAINDHSSRNVKELIPFFVLGPKYNYRFSAYTGMT
ncbi:hypothetical protein NDU88_003463 [Pleurodeles waltl]|uniref:Uncharacterized protein n=1 Tax=Pleurodeles waltl TaxID=8319 RepID=A0AAV7UC54_PLEWA|nr:hypothetical protein NDU88_003463 [Pleurodeles waltl]